MSHHRHAVNPEHYHTLPFGKKVLATLRALSHRARYVIESRLSK